MAYPLRHAQHEYAPPPLTPCVDRVSFFPFINVPLRLYLSYHAAAAAAAAHPGVCRGYGRCSLDVLPEVPQPVRQNLPPGETESRQDHHPGKRFNLFELYCSGVCFSVPSFECRVAMVFLFGKEASTASDACGHAFRLKRLGDPLPNETESQQGGLLLERHT